MPIQGHTDLVDIRPYGLRGSNFYWTRRKQFGLDDRHLADVLFDERVLVHEALIEPLLSINIALAAERFEIFVKDAYRPPAIYERLFERRVKLFGDADARSVFNMESMPHATGRAVDVALWDLDRQLEVKMRENADGTPALFIDFYHEKHEGSAPEFQSLQEYLAETMQRFGFRLGTKREYFHFNFDPDSPPNYHPPQGEPKGARR